MAMKILLVKTPDFSPNPANWPGMELVELSQISTAISGEGGGHTILLAHASLMHDAQLEGLLSAGFPLTSLFFRDQAQADHFGSSFSFLHAKERSTGIKNCLERGSSIYSETFFSAGTVGAKLDPVFRFARKSLTPKRAIDTWGSLQSLIFLGLRALPGQGENGTGERVDVQIGGDKNLLAFSVRFDLAPEQFFEIRKHPLWELPRSACDFLEFRYLQSAKKVEVLAVSFLSSAEAAGIEARSFQPSASSEASGDAKEYSFKTFSEISANAPEEKRVIKGGFKKKFSETLTAAGASGTAPAEKVTATEEKIVNADDGNFLVTGEVLQKTQEAKVVVSGSASMGKEKQNLAAAEEKAKSESLWESKIQSLNETLKQRDELIAMLNKEIEEIKDPLKMGVISNIKDNQVQGLKANLDRLQSELEEARAREKELLAVVDKAIQMKDDAVKKFKELDVKLRQSQGGNNSKVVVLEKQLEEQKRQNKEMSKRITQLTEQLTAAGLRAA